MVVVDVGGSYIEWARSLIVIVIVVISTKEGFELSGIVNVDIMFFEKVSIEQDAEGCAGCEEEERGAYRRCLWWH